MYIRLIESFFIAFIFVISLSFFLLLNYAFNSTHFSWFCSIFIGGKAHGSNGYILSRFYRIDESCTPHKLLPLHPLKCFSSNTINTNSNTNSNSSSSSSDNNSKSNNNSSNSLHDGHTVATRLLETWPNYLEKLCPTTSPSHEFLSSSSSVDRMHLAYESFSAAGKGIMSKCHTPVPYDVPLEGNGEPFSHSLTFDSEFECGNLLRAVQRGDASYDLFLRSDLHTEGHTQWFYFAVSNTHPLGIVKLSEQGVQVPSVRVRFNIVNLTKPDSLFNSGRTMLFDLIVCVYVYVVKCVCDFVINCSYMCVCSCYLISECLILS